MAAVGLHDLKENPGAAHVYIVIGNWIFDALADCFESHEVDHCVWRKFFKDARQKRFVSNISGCELNVSTSQLTHSCNCLWVAVD